MVLAVLLIAVIPLGLKAQGGCRFVPLNCDDQDSCTKDSCINGTCVFFVEGGYGIPNAFSPNGDGVNDRFHIFGDLEGIELKIFNRWGEKVFESNQQYYDWDGTYKDSPLNMDVFTYTLVITHCNGRKKLETGTITLIQ